jgi:hypothetical protein
MTSVVDKAQMNSREDMIKMALTYPAGLKIGSVVKVDSPMAPDAYHYENGLLMAGPGSTFEGSGVLDVWHSFKIYGGQIQAAEAYCEIVPTGMKSGVRSQKSGVRSQESEVRSQKSEVGVGVGIGSCFGGVRPRPRLRLIKSEKAVKRAFCYNLSAIS